jgi:hypothetical protein
MNQFTVLSAVVALGTATRSGALLDAPTVQPWLDKHLPNLVTKAQALRDGATWTEVGALLEAAVQAAQELKPVLAGTARAAFVLAAPTAGQPLRGHARRDGLPATVPGRVRLSSLASVAAGTVPDSRTAPDCRSDPETP